jgi:hypothetical protein
MIDNKVARAFGLDAAGWSRHANPWSVYTRIPVPVLLAAAVDAGVARDPDHRPGDPVGGQAVVPGPHGLAPRRHGRARPHPADGRPLTTRAYGAFDRRTACGGGVLAIWKTKPRGTVNRQNRAGT